MIHKKILSLLVLLLTAVTGAWADPNILAPTITGDREFYDKVEVTLIRNSPDGDIYYTLDGTTSPKSDNAPEFSKNQAPIVLTETTTIKAAAFDGNDWSAIVEVTFTKLTRPEVTFNDAKTTASFEMPAYDATVSYELVRDMSVQMQAQVGDDPAKEPHYRVQRNGESWFPADLNPEQVMALFSVNDLIEKKTLAPNSYLVSIYAVDAEGQPTGNAMDFQTFTFAPGRYAVTASALLDAPYEGTTALSNIFELFQGYEITVGAGEYATFYKDEIIYTEDEDAELYTISSVSDTEAVLSDKLAMVAANTPMLVYNKGTEAKTFILLPSLKEDADEVTVAREFRGTLAEKEMPASSTTVDYYVCTGKAFEWVRDAGVIAANKCWLQIGEQVAAARAMTRSIVGGGNTTNMDDVRWQMEDGNYYDLQGRKVEKPNRKGIYIHNGRKVVKR